MTILENKRQLETRRFLELHDRPGKGNDKGNVEGLAGYARRNFLVPLPAFESFAALNAYLEKQRRKRKNDRQRGRGETMASDWSAVTPPFCHYRRWPMALERSP